MKRIRINTTFEEDEKERKQYFASLSYSERLHHYFKLRSQINFNRSKAEKERVFKIYHSHNAN